MVSKKSSVSLVVLITAVALALGGGAWADSAIFTRTNGVYSPSATFTQIGNTLVVTLQNTSAADVLVPTDVLTGVFFNSAYALTPSSASLVSGDTV